jgi:hypothetical protein
VRVTWHLDDCLVACQISPFTVLQIPGCALARIVLQLRAPHLVISHCCAHCYQEFASFGICQSLRFLNKKEKKNSKKLNHFAFCSTCTCKFNLQQCQHINLKLVQVQFTTQKKHSPVSFWNKALAVSFPGRRSGDGILIIHKQSIAPVENQEPPTEVDWTERACINPLHYFYLLYAHCKWLFIH